MNIVNDVISSRLSYLEPQALMDLIEVVRKTNPLEGDIVECGCALGGSAICIGSAKPKNKSLFVYDVFGMIPKPGERDEQDVHDRYEIIKSGKSTGIGGDLYYGYHNNLYEEVESSFKRLLKIDNLQDNKIHLIKGLFEDTLYLKTPIAMAHVDCDWYDSVKVCLDRIAPNLVVGGIIVIDDYGAWSGCRDAVNDFFESRNDFTYEVKSRLHLIKTR